MILPRRLKNDALERNAQLAIVRFVQQRLAEGTGPYRDAFAAAKTDVAALFRATNNLQNLNPTALRSAPMVDAARYLAGPPISNDDLRTLVQAHLAAAGGCKEDAIIHVLRLCLDPFRFPWLRPNVDAPPSRKDVATAIVWTSSLWAVEKCRTSRRTLSSAAQEQAVASLLRMCDLEELIERKPIEALDALPRGHFTREVLLGGTKADLAIRFLDGRLLAIECKVSNSAVNSVKRLNREAAGKAERWRTHYGHQVVPAVVLAGVFKVTNLVDAQDAGVFIFWEHALDELGDYVRSQIKRC